MSKPSKQPHNAQPLASLVKAMRHWHNVYALCCLTPVEIKIVEDSAK
jgi:hypothetical protein